MIRSLTANMVSVEEKLLVAETLLDVGNGVANEHSIKPLVEARYATLATDLEKEDLELDVMTGLLRTYIEKQDKEPSIAVIKALQEANIVNPLYTPNTYFTIRKVFQENGYNLVVDGNAGKVFDAISVLPKGSIHRHLCMRAFLDRILYMSDFAPIFDIVKKVTEEVKAAPDNVKNSFVVSSGEKYFVDRGKRNGQE